MKVTHHHVPYSDIPRLVQEGVIKVGTKVKCGSLTSNKTVLEYGV
jgi:hypothetical protein